MTPEQLKAARKIIAPHMTQNAFALALGYAEPSAYRKYEAGMRPVPVLLEKMMILLSVDPSKFALIAANQD